MTRAVRAARADLPLSDGGGCHGLLFQHRSQFVTYTWKSPRYAKRQAERDAVHKARPIEPYLERQARREAVPPLKRRAREVVPYLERQAARAAERNADERDG